MGLPYGKSSFLLLNAFLKKWALTALFIRSIGGRVYHSAPSRGSTEWGKSWDLKKGNMDISLGLGYQTAYQIFICQKKNETSWSTGPSHCFCQTQFQSAVQSQLNWELALLSQVTTITTTTTKRTRTPTSYLSCYWPNLDQSLKVGTWEHLEQISAVTGTFVQATFLHISNISALNDPILTKL